MIRSTIASVHGKRAYRHSQTDPIALPENILQQKISSAGEETL
jgi:hypothetical protein